eukprot:3786165-Ditylum_brightwellii.AAC.1
MLGNAEETNKQISPQPATISSLQKSRVKIGGEYSVTFSTKSNKKPNANALGMTFFSPDNNDKIKE